MQDHDGQDDDEFPLADHPPYRGPKAGDPEYRRARDLEHYDVAGGRKPIPQAQKPTHVTQAGAGAPRPSTLLPESAPVMQAWRAFNASQPKPWGDEHFSLFLAGWTARDHQQ